MGRPVARKQMHPRVMWGRMESGAAARTGAALRARRGDTRGGRRARTERRSQRRIMRTMYWDIGPACNRFGSGKDQNFDQNEFQARRRMRIVLEPVERDRIVVVRAGRHHDTSAVTAPAHTRRQMRMGNESLCPMRLYEVIRVLVAVQMQEWGRKHGRRQSR